MHAVISRALKVSGNRLRLRTPPGLRRQLRRQTGHLPLHRPHWRRVARSRASSKVDRGSSGASDNLGFRDQSRDHTRGRGCGRRQDFALEWDQVEDCGAHLRAPEPATLYRMHGNLTGAYDIRHVAVRNRVVVTNKTPTGLNRGFGAPQVYFALERLVQRIAVELDLDPLDVIKPKRNKLLPSWRRFRATIRAGARGAGPVSPPLVAGEQYARTRGGRFDSDQRATVAQTSLGRGWMNDLNCPTPTRARGVSDRESFPGIERDFRRVGSAGGPQCRTAVGRKIVGPDISFINQLVSWCRVPRAARGIRTPTPSLRMGFAVCRGNL